jgi:uncharacterized protein YecE (DUF72 family)
MSPISLLEKTSNIKNPEVSAQLIAAAEEKTAKLTELWKQALDHSEACKKEEERLGEELKQLKRSNAATPEQIREAKRQLDAASDISKVAQKELRKAHTKAHEEFQKTENIKKRENGKVLVVDGYVVDIAGNRIRRYGRFERFVDNKLLSYGLLGLALAAMLVITYLMAVSQH